MEHFTLFRRGGRYIFLSMFFTCLGLFYSYGQVLSDTNSAPAAPLVPDAWQFIRFDGGHTPDLYTGTNNVSIPIYTYKDPDFELPISISYASNGFRPNDQQGIVGLGWSLSVGGMITREIIGIPDDYMDLQNTVTGLPTERYGYYYYHLLSQPSNIFTRFTEERRKNFELGINNRAFNPYMYQRDNNGIKRGYETAPDIFSFKFGDHSGKFILGPENKIYVFSSNHPSGEYKIDFEITNDGINRIIITTGDGYKYYFGDTKIQRYGRYQSGAPTIPEYLVGTLSDYSTSWPLTSIIAPNSNEVSFEYDLLADPDYSTAPPFYQTFSPTVYEYGPQMETGELQYTCNYLVKRYVYIQKSVIQYRLSKIKIGLNEISFSYQDKERQYCQNGNSSKRIEIYDTRGLLSRITVKNKYQSVKQFDFTYVYNTNATRPYDDNSGNAISFLKYITMPDKGVYRFDYYNEILNAPYYGTTRVDYAGYYNSATHTNVHTDYGLNNILQEVNPEGALYGMLKQVTYPTTGYTVFTYEPHDYSKIMVRHRSDILTAPYLIDTGGKDYLGAGLRIKTITDYVKRVNKENSADVLVYASSSLYEPDSVIRREYVYQDQGRSSGNCLTYARQLYDNRTQLSMSANNINAVGSSNIPGADDLMAKSMNIPLSVDQTGIEYHTVIEKLCDGSSRKYRFCSYDDLPDIMLRTDTLSHTVNRQMKSTTFIETPSLAVQRGKLLNVESYDPENKLVLKQENIYSWAPLTTIPYLKSLSTFFYITHHYVEDYLLEAVKTTEYFDADSLQTIKRIAYNALNQPKTIQTYNNSRLSNTLSIEYLHERQNLSGNLSSNVRSQNLMSYVAEQQTKNYSMDGERIGVQSTVSDYMLTSAQLVLPISTSIVNYIENDTESHEAQREITFDKYASNGRVLQTRDRNNIPTSYLWSYDQQYLLAKVSNVFYDDLATIHSANERLTDAQKAQLRAIPGALVETFDYIPLVGLSKYVDTNGVETSYEYYPSGKLKYIKDAAGNIISEYDYSLK